MSEPTTHTLDVVPGAVLHYGVRVNGSGAHPVLLLIGSPMDAAGFATLADYFADRIVVTYDPGRSERADGATTETIPDEHAADPRRVLAG